MIYFARKAGDLTVSRLLKAQGAAVCSTIEALGVPVLVVRKRQKNMYLSVRPDGSLRVTCPAAARDGEVIAFVASHADWLRKRREVVKQKAETKERSLVAGDILPLWGKTYVLDVRTGRPWGVALNDGTLLMTAPDPSTREERETLLRRFYVAQIRTAVPPLLRRWQSFLGVKAGAIAVRSMVSRWGSCNTRTGRICVNLRLAEKDARCLEYVVVHELCHLLVPDHSPAFWTHVARCLPDWRDLRRLTRDGAEASEDG